MGREVRATEQKVVAAFDFDGTITSRDSLPIFILFAVRAGRLLAGGLQSIPYILLYKLKFIPNYKAKEQLFKAFFAGMPVDLFNELATKFSMRIDKIVNPIALEKIKWHQTMGHEVVIVSASPENWIRPWADQNGIKIVLSTKLQTNDGIITGRFLSKNCHGAEKVARLLERYPDRSHYELYAYGDSSGDKELLELADHAFYRSF